MAKKISLPKFRKMTPSRVERFRIQKRAQGFSTEKIERAIRAIERKPYYSSITGKRYKTEKSIAYAERKATTPLEEQFFSNITGRYYLTEEGRRAAERRAYRGIGYQGEDPELRAIQELDNSFLPMSYTSLSGMRNRWTHQEGGILHELFYIYSNGDWLELKSGAIVWYYGQRGLDVPDIQGHTLMDFIRFVMGVNLYDI